MFSECLFLSCFLRINCWSLKVVRGADENGWVRMKAELAAFVVAFVMLVTHVSMLSCVSCCSGVHSSLCWKVSQLPLDMCHVGLECMFVVYFCLMLNSIMTGWGSLV